MEKPKPETHTKLLRAPLSTCERTLIEIPVKYVCAQETGNTKAQAQTSTKMRWKLSGIMKVISHTPLNSVS